MTQDFGSTGLCSALQPVNIYFCTLKTHQCCPFTFLHPGVPNKQTRLIFYGWVVCSTHKQELLTGFYQYDYSLKSLLHLSNACSVFIFGSEKKNLSLMQKLCVKNYLVPVSLFLTRFLTCHGSVLLNGACFQSFCSDWNKGFCIFDKSLLRTIKQ